MKSDQVLWQRIDEHQLDDPEAEFPFSARLARENGWSREFALKVIEEYKRFCYLAMVAGHEVTPSDEVDQAWHLHMTYTRDYWGPFKKVLGKPLHHGPTRGGKCDAARFEGNYEATLWSYEKQFGAEPPKAIWPPTNIRFGRAPTFRRVSSADYWMLPKQAVLMAAAAFTALIYGWFVVLGDASAKEQTPLSSGMTMDDLGLIFAVIAAAMVICIYVISKRSAGWSAGAGWGSGCGGGRGGD